MPSGRIFIADYASIEVREANAPADLKGVVRVFCRVLVARGVPSLDRLERAGDLFVLGGQGGFLISDPTQDSIPLALVAQFTITFSQPVDVDCNGRIDGRLIDAEISAEVPE